MLMPGLLNLILCLLTGGANDNCTSNNIKAIIFKIIKGFFNLIIRDLTLVDNCNLNINN